MKRPIFWLIFSCLTAIPFLSYSMGEIGTFKELDRTCETATAEQLLSLLAFNSYMTKLEEKDFEFFLSILDQKITSNQPIITQTSSKKEFAFKEQFKGFLVRQLINTLGLILSKSNDWRTFFVNASNEFYQTNIDKKKLKKLLLNLSSTYLPDTIDNIRMNLLGVLFFEELAEHLKNIPYSIDMDKNILGLLNRDSINIWELLKKGAFLHFFLNQYLYKS